MRIPKFGHSCLLLEQGSARILLDPGVFSAGFEELRGLTAVLVTHQHPDHLDRGRLDALLSANPQAQVLADSATAAELGPSLPARAVTTGDEVMLADVPVRVVGRDHAVIHPDIPVIPNVGYLVGGHFYYPGDALTDPGEPVEVLGLPTGAPWLKLSDSVDFLRRVRPTVAVPVHDAVVAQPQVWFGLYRGLAQPVGTTVTVLEPGAPVDV